MTEGRTFGTISRRSLLVGARGAAALGALAGCSPGGSIGGSLAGR